MFIYQAYIPNSVYKETLVRKLMTRAPLVIQYLQCTCFMAPGASSQTEEQLIIQISGKLSDQVTILHMP